MTFRDVFKLYWKLFLAPKREKKNNLATGNQSPRPQREIRSTGSRMEASHQATLIPHKIDKIPESIASTTPSILECAVSQLVTRFTE